MTMRAPLQARRLGLILVLGFLCRPLVAFDRIEVGVSPRRPGPGETVSLRFKPPGGADEIHAALLRPSLGRVPLILKPAAAGDGWFEAAVRLDPVNPEGLYAVHAWTGDEKAPRAVGKGWFLHGRIVADYPIMSLVDPTRPREDIRAYLEDFRSLGGNALVVHVLMTPAKAYYPSRIAKTDVAPGTDGDYVETFLDNADRLGFACLLSVSWDMTHDADYADFPAQIRAVTDELWGLYGHHPSLAGFYSYQEGSGTYLAPYLRDFCGHVKSLHPNLLTSCAPYVDDPLLSGYLSMLDSLDVLIFQGMTMASFRPDNVKRYPLRRVRNLCGVGIGGKWLQDKIAITHTELFGYLENRVSKNYSTTTYENILPQILSAATAAGSDGISFFTYHANIHSPARKYPEEIARPRQAVVDGLKAFDAVWKNTARGPSAFAFYYPYEDWIVERWAVSFVPALDAFRVLGVPADFLPFAPAPRESFYPFYPYGYNEAALGRLLETKTALILPNVSGFHKTDSDFIKAFLERGGAVAAFGPRLPMGNTYDRDALLGAAEGSKAVRASIVSTETAGRRVKAGARFALRGGNPFSGWKAAGAKVAAAFEDGSAAVFVNGVGKGVIASVALDAATAARDIPDIVRDVLDEILAATGTARTVDILGTTENVDLASARIPGGCRVSVVNHEASPLKVVLRPLRASAGGGSWTDLVSGARKPGRESDGGLALAIPGRGFACWEYKE